MYCIMKTRRQKTEDDDPPDGVIKMTLVQMDAQFCLFCVQILGVLLHWAFCTKAKKQNYVFQVTGQKKMRNERAIFLQQLKRSYF